MENDIEMKNVENQMGLLILSVCGLYHCGVIVVYFFHFFVVHNIIILLHLVYVCHVIIYLTCHCTLSFGFMSDTDYFCRLTNIKKLHNM